MFKLYANSTYGTCGATLIGKFKTVIEAMKASGSFAGWVSRVDFKGTKQEAIYFKRGSWTIVPA